MAWAHPRSRGENARPWCPRHSPAGSSPLTRGKPHHLTLARALLRLIPAHAGKTATGQATFRRLAAHPRSRGENSLFRRAREPCGGSSPLTRGKLPALPAPDPFPGLIPAHAGKTRIATSVCSLSTAHPRSRGENVSHASDALLIWGSSPLTRGKLLARTQGNLLQRLIPAHAGKTSRRTCPSRRREAHPHSRGENAAGIASVALTQGSSPLTRGKRLDQLQGALWPRLIPAHAGKTHRQHTAWPASTAHPRSRGKNLLIHSLRPQ